MSSQVDPRYQSGKHLTLVEDTHLPYIANIQGYIVPAFAVWRGLCWEATALIKAGLLPEELLDRVRAVESFLNDGLRLSVSVSARGRDDLTSAIRGLEEDRIHRDSGLKAFDPSGGQKQPSEGSKHRRGF